MPLDHLGHREVPWQTGAGDGAHGTGPLGWAHSSLVVALGDPWEGNWQSSSSSSYHQQSWSCACAGLWWVGPSQLAQVQYCVLSSCGHEGSNDEGIHFQGWLGHSFLRCRGMVSRRVRAWHGPRAHGEEGKRLTKIGSLHRIGPCTGRASSGNRHICYDIGISIRTCIGAIK